MTVLAIDAGTTGVTALVVGAAGGVVARGYQEFPQHFPQPGWVEHDPDEIWTAVVAAASAALEGGSAGSPPMAVGITNQRETAVLWDRKTLRPARRAIVWQDRRTAALCAALRADGVEADVS
ncbi:MAG: glycerol kinase, partial [Frankiaceae bacterium]|nr:glycerol kinase [Frankiaceae bacterium]